MNTRFKFYRVTTQHDKGIAHFRVFQPNQEAAIRQVMACEYCPRRAIIRVEDLTPKRFDVISPDGFSIYYGRTYKKKRTAYDAVKDWAKQFTGQGYYSSPYWGKIPVNEIPAYCRLITIK